MVQLDEAVVVRGEPVVAEPVAAALADPAHVASAVAVAGDRHGERVDSVPVLIRDAFVVVAAAVEQLRVVAPVAVGPAPRHVHLAAVVVAQIALHVQLAAHLPHVPLVAVRFVAVAAPALCAVVRVERLLCHAAVEPVELVAAEQSVVETFAPLAVRRVPAAHLSF